MPQKTVPRKTMSPLLLLLAGTRVGAVLMQSDTALTSTFDGVTTRCSKYSDDGICLLPEFRVNGLFYRLYSQNTCGGTASQLWCYVSTQGDSTVVFHESEGQEELELDGHALRFTMNYGGCGCMGCSVHLSAGGYTITGVPQDTDNLFYDNIKCEWPVSPPTPPALPPLKPPTTPPATPPSHPGIVEVHELLVELRQRVADLEAANNCATFAKNEHSECEMNPTNDALGIVLRGSAP